MRKTGQVSSFKGHIFACTEKSEKECFKRMLFSTNKLYADKVLRVIKGDILFLLNMDKDTLYGIFRAASDGKKDIEPEAWGGKYPYQVKVKSNGEIKSVREAKKLFSKMGINWTDTLNERGTKLLSSYLENPEEFDWETFLAVKNGKRNSSLLVEIEDERPRLEATTLWDYPRQSYGKTPKGDNKYAGVTPAFIIYNLVKRYTEPGDLVVDPMAGSGTTLDVCKEEGRKCIAYDIAPTRLDVIQNDARSIPLPDNSVDMIFIDSPYGDNVRYNEHPDDIGKISSETEKFYDELEKVMHECCRILKPGKVLGWLIGDQWVKKKFTPVGFKVHQRLSKYFDTLDIISVVRRGQTSNTGIWYNRAIRFNFYLRGFKYLFIMRKPSQDELPSKNRKVNWFQYPRRKNDKKSTKKARKVKQ
ncbi:MAG: DNA methyltransferase [Nitrososphaerales archaeon]